MKKLTFATVVFFTLVASAFAADESNFIIAKINNKAITNLELQDRYRYVVGISKLSIKTQQDKKLLLGQVLDKMIDEELIRQEAQNLKVEVTPDEIRETIDVVAAQQRKNATQLKLYFINNRLSFDNYLRQVESEIAWSKIIGEFMRAKVKVTDVETREFFEQHKFNTDVKRFLIAEILISPSENAAQLASKLAVELRQGADFKNIVKQFSSSINSENNGEIGWVSQGDIDAKIYAAISKLGKGGYSDPVLLADGYHIFKLLDFKTETKVAEQDLAAAKNAIFSRKLQSVAKGYLMDLRKKAFVEIERDRLE